jgi:hypothetical protein
MALFVSVDARDVSISFWPPWLWATPAAVLTDNMTARGDFLGGPKKI